MFTHSRRIHWTSKHIEGKEMVCYTALQDPAASASRTLMDYLLWPLLFSSEVT
jgi:hypothetical protein